MDFNSMLRRGIVPSFLDYDDEDDMYYFRDLCNDVLGGEFDDYDALWAVEEMMDYKHKRFPDGISNHDASQVWRSVQKAVRDDQ